MKNNFPIMVTLVFMVLLHTGCSSRNYVVRRGDLTKVKKIISDGYDIDARDSDGYTLLNIATYYNKPEIVRFLIEKGANLEIKNNGGFTSLLSAVYYGHNDIVELLLKDGADPNTPIKAQKMYPKSSYGKFEGFTALHLAAYYGYGTIAVLLLE